MHTLYMIHTFRLHEIAMAMRVALRMQSQRVSLDWLQFAICGIATRQNSTDARQSDQPEAGKFCAIEQV